MGTTKSSALLMMQFADSDLFCISILFQFCCITRRGTALVARLCEPIPSFWTVILEVCLISNVQGDHLSEKSAGVHNLTSVREMSGYWPSVGDVREITTKKSYWETSHLGQCQYLVA